MLNKIKNIKLSKSKYIYLVIFCVIIIAIGVTFAWWRWSSDINALIYGEVCAPEIVFVGGTTINGHDLLPVRTKEEGLTKDIHVNLNNTCDNDTAVLNLNLLLENFPLGLSDASFKWALYEVEDIIENDVVTGQEETYVNSGNFANKEQNQEISIATDLIVTENISTYRLYIWIDGTMDNPSTIGDNSFGFKLYGTGTGAIYNQYTMKQVSNSSATSSFWGSPIKANQVKSIRFIPTDQVSDEWTNTYNLSSVTTSNDVTMYYVENGQTESETPITLYDVYVASNNGMSKVKTNTSASSMFRFLTNCEYIDAEGLDTSNATSMFYMFEGSNMSEVKLSNWDTSKVTNMERMFQNCRKLEELDLSNFNTSSVKTTGMTVMFWNCPNLKKLNIGNFDTSQVTNLYYMFNGCKSLEELDLSKWDTSRVVNMGSMFCGCNNLKKLNLNNWNTSAVTTMNDMFLNCTSLKSLDLSSFDISNVTSVNYMFRNCSSLEALDLSSFRTFKAKSMSYMFAGCSKLKELNISNLITSQVENMSYVFNGCRSLTELDLSNFDTSNVTTMGWMFRDCTNLKRVNLSGFDTSKVRQMDCLFTYCSSLESVDLSSFRTPELLNISNIFFGCNKLTNVDISNFDFSGITSTQDAFTFVPAAATITVKDCGQYNLFRTKFGSGFTNLQTPNNDNCTV